MLKVLKISDSWERKIKNVHQNVLHAFKNRLSFITKEVWQFVLMSHGALYYILRFEKILTVFLCEGSEFLNC